MTNYKHDKDGSGTYYCCPSPQPPRPPKPRPQINQTILSCGNGSGLIIPEHNQNNSQLFNPYVIASVSINTSELKRANVKIDFSAIILFNDDDSDDLRLTFQLSKSFMNGSKIALGTWNFERFTTDGSRFELVDSFGFTFCECAACPGCAYYTVELTNAETNNVDCVAITSPNISALAVGPLADCFSEY